MQKTTEVPYSGVYVTSQGFTPRFVITIFFQISLLFDLSINLTLVHRTYMKTKQ